MNGLTEQITNHTQKLPESLQQEVLDFVVSLEERQQTKDKARHPARQPAPQTSWDVWRGRLKDSPNLNEGPLAIQQQLRDEWP